MTNVKDKLSASVRQARAAQQPGGESAATSGKPAQPAASVQAATAKPATAKPSAAKPAAAKPAAARPASTRSTTAKAAPATASANSPRSSAGELFPARVWPD